MTQSTPGVAVLSPMAGPALSARNLGAMLLLALMWGLSIPVTKIGLETVPPITLTALRFVAAVPLFLVLATGRLRVPWKAVPGIVGLGVMGIAGGNVTQAYGVQGTSASAGTIISATIPIFVVVFAAIRLHQPVTGRQWVGLFAAFGGIALVAVGSGSDGDDMTRTTLTGVAWMLVSAAIIAFYFIWSAELAEKYGTLPVAAWNALAGLVAVMPLAG
jgi:drug/metabolite transporter (DMT)-like permease